MKLKLASQKPDHATRKAFAKRRRIQVRDFFEAGAADRIMATLETETPWWLAFNNGEKVEQLPPNAVSLMSPQQRADMIAGIQNRARVQYQFLYQYFPLYSHYFSKDGEWQPIFHLYEFLNSEPVLDYFRTLTGHDEIKWMDAHATLYRAGSFLKFHTDENEKDQRVAAYVLNFTKDWGRDWGGLLQFWNEQFDVEEALRPIFNALNIFLVPMDHSVSMVANYVDRGRYSVTGWLRADDPPGAFDRSSREGRKA